MSTAERPLQDSEHPREGGDQLTLESLHQDPTLFDRLSTEQQRQAFDAMRMGHITVSSELSEVSDELLQTRNSLAAERAARDEATRENEELKHFAYHDDLTGALNRRGLETFLDKSTLPKALILIDAANFKAVNEEYGYDGGDAVIKDTYEVLKQSIRPGDVIARLGGDEFVIVVNGEEVDEDDTQAESDRRSRKEPTPEELIAILTERIGKQTEAYLEGSPNLKEVNFNISVGGVKWDPTKSLKELIKTAEPRMKAHKASQHAKGRYNRASGTMQ